MLQQHYCLTNVGMCTISILIVSFRFCFQAHNHPIDVKVIDERYHRGFYFMVIDGQRFSGHLFAPLLTPVAMQIYSLITVSLIWISHFDLNVDVTILYSCPHIFLPPPPTQADAEAVRESICGAFARGTIPSAASAGLLSHCLIARMPHRSIGCIARALPAHAHAAWPTHGS